MNILEVIFPFSDLNCVSTTRIPATLECTNVLRRDGVVRVSLFAPDIHVTERVVDVLTRNPRTTSMLTLQVAGMMFSDVNGFVTQRIRNTAHRLWIRCLSPPAIYGRMHPVYICLVMV